MSFESFDKNPLFKKGQIEMHSPDLKRKKNFRRNRSQAAELTGERNTREALTRNFLEITPLYRKEFGTRGMVQTMIPTSSYAYGGVMVTAAGKELMEDYSEDVAGDMVSTETPYDLDEDVRCEYFKQVLASIQAEEDTLLPRNDQDTFVISYENNMANISTDQHRLPRTIALPHTHIIKAGNWFNENDLPSRPVGFKLEQDFLQNEDLFVRFRDAWESFLSAESINIPELLLRKNAPYGYTIRCSMDRSVSLDVQSDFVSKVLTYHHKVYQSFVKAEIEKLDIARQLRKTRSNATGNDSPHKIKSLADTLSLQPSYRTYIYYSGSELRITISPMFVTPVGALQAMDVGIHRSKEHTKHFSDDEMGDFFSRLTTNLSKKMS